MDRSEAEDYIYESYLRAEKKWNWEDQDSEKRHPEYSKKILEGMSHTPCAVVTGSKGKGSVSAMISAILSTELKVGLMTSPHISSFNERFRINGEDISDEDFIRHVTIVKEELDPIADSIPEDTCISPMGIQSAVALSYFNETQTDFNVFECGKGAETDDVNNIIHDYSVINTIFLEHTRELGSTLEDIASNKSHVITGREKCVYVAEQEEPVMGIIRQRADRAGVKVKSYGGDFSSDNVRYTEEGMVFDVRIGTLTIPGITLPLLGEHQARNCALAAALCLDVLGKFDIDKVKKALSEIKWPGRFEAVHKNPMVILDACVNEKSCKEIIPLIEKVTVSQPNVVIAIPDDKDYRGVARAISSISNKIIMTRTDNPHYIFSPSQTEELKKEGVTVAWSDSLTDAIADSYDKDRAIIVLGTTSVVSQVKKMQMNKAFDRLFEQ